MNSAQPIERDFSPGNASQVLAEAKQGELAIERWLGEGGRDLQRTDSSERTSFWSWL